MAMQLRYTIMVVPHWHYACINCSQSCGKLQNYCKTSKMHQSWPSTRTKETRETATITIAFHFYQLQPHMWWAVRPISYQQWGKTGLCFGTYSVGCHFGTEIRGLPTNEDRWWTSQPCKIESKKEGQGHCSAWATACWWLCIGCQLNWRYTGDCQSFCQCS